MSATKQQWQFLIETTIEELQKTIYKNQSRQQINEKLRLWTIQEFNDYVQRTFTLN